MNRVISSFLALALVLSLITPVMVAPASAAEMDVEYDASLVDVWDNHFHDTWGILGGEGLGFVSSFFVAECWGTMNDAMNKAVFGLAPSLAVLHRRANIFNAYFESALAEAFGPILWMGMMPHAEVMWVENLNAYVICDTVRGIPLITIGGAYAYYREEAPQDKWIDSTYCDPNGQVVILTENVLADLCLSLNQAGETCSLVKWAGKYLVIAKDHYYYYCNPDGIPYVFRVDQNYAVDSPNNYYTNNEGDNIYNGGDTVNTTLIDNSSSVVWFPDGTLQYIDQLIYDESTKTYYVDAHSEYNTTNNTYVSNTYYYEYHIDYTSITYIGSTAEYDKEYYLYYELPDGRSSADLTAEDLEVLNVSMDLIPYVRTADDTSIRALYHFDGDTLDSSYWSYIGNLEWTQGASITYMEANAFNGALYLDENEHDFTVHLPGNLGTGDFTIQFRYYASHTATPYFDSFMQLGGVRLLTFNGAYFGSSAGALCAISTGNWQDVCVMRKDGVLYAFVNGVCYASAADRTIYDDELRFVFGDTQQTYKYFDELRVLNKAAYDPAGYTPSSVPFDTNLSLVLPDTVIPVADEYWSFNSEGNLLAEYNMVGSTMDASIIHSCSDVWGCYDSDRMWHYSSKADPGVELLTDSLRIHSTILMPILKYIDDYSQCPGLLESISTSRTYTFSVMLSDGSVASVTGYLRDVRNGLDRSLTLDNGSRIGFGCAYDPSAWGAVDGAFGLYLYIQPPEGGSMDIVYAELKEGSSANTGHEFVSAVAAIDREDLDKATLAVRTDLEISGHQIGGVRPSLPIKGLVWALVESGRITSLQIYNGQAWEEVDGRIWTGERWIPYYAFDILLLKDMYDVVESDPTMNPIYTETGFWKWLQDAWGQMLDKLDQIIIGLSGGLGGCEHDYKSVVDREAECIVSGLVTYICSKCGHSYTDTVDAKGHDWVLSVSGALTVSGETVTLTDCVDASLRGLVLYGKSTQDGVPSLDDPSELVSAGANGEIIVSVSGAGSVQSLVVSTPGGLPGIPVNSGGVYTDQNGQQWICDEIDFERGLYIQRVKTLVFDGSERWTKSNASACDQYTFTVSDMPKSNTLLMCDSFSVKSDHVVGHCYFYQNIFGCNPYAAGTSSVSDWKAYLADHPVTIIYALKTPVEVPLFAAQLDPYSSLMVSGSGTVISNDCGVGMSVSYLSRSVPDLLVCAKCGATAEDYGKGPVSVQLPSDSDFGEDDWALVDALVVCKDGVWSFMTGIVRTAFGGLSGFVSGVGSVGDFFGAYKPNRGSEIFGILEYEGVDIWD